MAGRRVNKKDETQEEAHRNDGLDLAARLYLSGYLYRYHDTAVPGLRLGAGYPCNLCVCHTGRGVRYPGVVKTNKDKRQDRRWQREDMKREREAMEQAMQQTEEP